MNMNKKGFTLLELVTVIIIVGILAAAGIPLYLNYVEDAKIARAKATIDAIYSAERVHYQRNMSYWKTGPTPTTANAIKANLDIQLDPSIKNDWEFSVTGNTAGDIITIFAVGKASAAGLSTAFCNDTGSFTDGETPTP